MRVNYPLAVYSLFLLVPASLSVLNLAYYSSNDKNCKMLVNVMKINGVQL